MCEGASQQTPDLKILPRRDRPPPRFEIDGSPPVQYVTCLPRNILDLFSLFRKLLHSKIFIHFYRQNIENVIYTNRTIVCVFTYLSVRNKV